MSPSIVINKALELSPENPNYLYNWGLLHSMRDELDEAQKWCEKSLKYNNKNPFVYLALGDVFEKKEMVEEAIEVYKKLQELQPDFKDLDKKIAYLESIVKLKRERDEEEENRKKLKEQKEKDKKAEKLKKEKELEILQDKEEKKKQEKVKHEKEKQEKEKHEKEKREKEEKDKRNKEEMEKFEKEEKEKEKNEKEKQKKEQKEQKERKLKMKK